MINVLLDNLTLVHHGSVISLRLSFRLYLNKGFIHIPKQIAREKILQPPKRGCSKRENNDACLIFINYIDLVITRKLKTGKFYVNVFFFFLNEKINHKLTFNSNKSHKNILYYFAHLY